MAKRKYSDALKTHVPTAICTSSEFCAQHRNDLDYSKSAQRNKTSIRTQEKSECTGITSGRQNSEQVQLWSFTEIISTVQVWTNREDSRHEKQTVLS